MWWEECKSIEAKIIAMRRDLHKIPELGFHLPKTREYVTHQLDEIGIPYRLSEKDSSPEKSWLFGRIWMPCP